MRLQWLTLPRTMTRIGLRFLQALAAQKSGGVYLEIGPLFGSSTNAIAAGRSDGAAIHSIDTFEAAPWVRKRFGFDLSRERFDRHTGAIDNLVVHQGYAPDIVRKSWRDRIGFYFDDATHGDPGWSANYDFFKPHFADDAIVCGDDFACGWPDIVRNVYKLADAGNHAVFIMGRVWAFAQAGDDRLVAAVDATCPAVKGIQTAVLHRGCRTNGACGGVVVRPAPEPGTGGVSG